MKAVLKPGFEDFAWSAVLAQDAAYHYIGVEDGRNHAFLRGVFARTARTAVSTSRSITAGLTLAVARQTFRAIPKTRSRRLARSSSCHRGTTAAIGLPARSMMY